MSVKYLRSLFVTLMVALVAIGPAPNAFAALDAAIQTGSSSAGKANVDSNYNLQVRLPIVKTQTGFVNNQNEIDAGLVTGAQSLRSSQITYERRQQSALDNVLFSDTFNAAAQNTALWKSAATTFTFGFGGGYLTFNNGAVTTTGSSQIYQSYKTFPLFSQAGLTVDYSSTATALPGANMQLDVGLFSANVASAPYDPTDGAYIRTNSTGLYGVVNYAGTETVTGLLIPAASLTTGTNGMSRMVISTEAVEFWGGSDGNLVLLARLPAPAGNGQPFSASSAPFSARLKFTGTASTAYQTKLSGVSILSGQIQQNRLWGQTMASMGNAYQGLNGGTMGSLALYTNSLAPGAGAAMTNTTAALGTGLGGQFSALPTLTANTDGIVSSYQIPAGGTAQTPRAFCLTGIKVQGMVTTALTGGPVIYAYSLAYGSTNVSLATTEAVAAKAPRRIPLGWENYAATAAVGAQGQGVAMDFSSSPVCGNPGEFIQLAAKNVGTVTSAGVITFLVTPIGYFE